MNYNGLLVYLVMCSCFVMHFYNLFCEGRHKIRNQSESQPAPSRLSRSTLLAHQKKIDASKALFEAYYECLGATNPNYQMNPEKIESRLLLQGQDTTLNCGLW